MRVAQWFLAGGLAIAHATSSWAADGLAYNTRPDTMPWANWQGRISVGATALSWRSGLARYDGSETTGLKFNSFTLMGDYYFTRSFLGSGSSGGFRATSGVIVGPRSVLWTNTPGRAAGNAFSVDRRLFGQTARPPGMDAFDTATQPYVGVGYTGLSGGGGWTFSADLGLVGQSATSAYRLGRAPGSTPSLDDQLRDMRLAPVLQLGVSYSF